MNKESFFCLFLRRNLWVANSWVLLQRETWITSVLFKDRNKILSLHCCQFSKLLHGEGRTKITPTLLSSSLPVHEEGAVVPEILPFLCFSGLSKSIYKYIHISNCIHGINAHVPYFTFISPGTVIPNSPDTILFITIKKTKLKTYVKV